MSKTINLNQPAWEITLENIVVPGHSIEQAITNALGHLSDKFLQGELPLVVSATKIKHDSTTETNQH